MAGPAAPAVYETGGPLCPRSRNLADRTQTATGVLTARASGGPARIIGSGNNRVLPMARRTNHVWSVPCPASILWPGFWLQLLLLHRGRSPRCPFGFWATPLGCITSPNSTHLVPPPPIGLAWTARPEASPPGLFSSHPWCCSGFSPTPALVGAVLAANLFSYNQFLVHANLDCPRLGPASSGFFQTLRRRHHRVHHAL